MTDVLVKKDIDLSELFQNQRKTKKVNQRRLCLHAVVATDIVQVLGRPWCALALSNVNDLFNHPPCNGNTLSSSSKYEAR